MSASIVYAHEWDQPEKQTYLAVNPSRDEIALYESVYAAKKWTTSRVAQLGDMESIQCSHHSPQDYGYVGAGLSNGSVYFSKLGSDEKGVKLIPRQYRPCNSVSINKNGLIAAGLDKVRGDNSLLIWDVESQSKSINGDTVIKSPVQSNVPNEVVSSVEFIPRNPNLLLCGSYKFMRELDLRTGTTNFQCTGKSAHGISVSPKNEFYFASYSEDGSFALWDRRYFRSGVTTGEPALIFSRFFSEPLRSSQKSNVCFRFSKSRAEEFATLQGGDTLRRWQLGVVPHQDADTKSSRGSHASVDQKLGYFSKNDSLFVSSVLDSKTEFDKVVGFDYAPDLTNKYKLDFMCIRQSGQVFRMKVVESPDATAFDPYNNVVVTEPEGMVILEPAVEKLDDGATDEEKEDSSDIQEFDTKKRTLSEVLIDEYEESEEEDEILSSQHKFKEGVMSYVSLLQNDISITMRDRALEGYGMDGSKNYEIVAKSSREKSKLSLRYIWKWLDFSIKGRDSGLMLSGQFDLGMEGVAGIWEGVHGLEKQRRILRAHGRKLGETEFNGAIDHINHVDGKQIFVSPSVSGTSKEAHRQLCLKITGWDFEFQDLEVRLTELETGGRHEQAAGWALFHGDVERCVRALASSRKERLRLMSTAVAGYQVYKDTATNNLWREQCQRLATDLDNPYLRAIFAFITYGSWDDVLDESSLPLAERLGIALRFLPDEKLTKFLSRSTERAVRNGDLEGIVLTGLTPKVIDLLQAYVDKTSDVQTVALIGSIGCPRYFKDNRAQNWVEDYRILLNHWRLFNLRAKFDVARTKLSWTSTGVQTNPPVPRQIFLRCTQCHGIIGQAPGNDSLSAAAIASRQQQLAHGGMKTASAMRCPHCNYPLPRCAICLLPLGTSAPAFDTPKDDYLVLFDKWPTYCLTCNHGLHAGHAREWFGKYDMCPVPDCNCLCNKV